MNPMNTHWSSEALTDSGARWYIAYPHSNGFADDGQSVVLAQLADGGVGFYKLNLTTGEQVKVFECAENPAEVTWFDVAADANVLAVIAEGSLWLTDLHTGQTKRLMNQDADTSLTHLPSITSDGELVLVGFRRGEEYGVLQADTHTGQTSKHFRVPWHANHAHFSPFDRDWISFCHEGPAMEIHDRVWARHRDSGSPGRCVMNQRALATEDGFLSVGHERACFHDRSAVVVAYGESQSGPRGLYEVFFDGRPPVLISAGERDWHCNVSRDGRWAVVDTTGPSDRPGRGWQDADGLSDIVLINRATGQRRVLAQCRHGRHPWHPHPTFDPTGRHILYTEASTDSERPSGRVMLLSLSTP